MTAWKEGILSNAGVYGAPQEPAPARSKDAEWKPPARKPRTLTFEVARSFEDEPVLNTLDLSRQFDQSL